MHRILSRPAAILSMLALAAAAAPPPAAAQGGAAACRQGGGGGARCEQIRAKIKERVAARGGQGAPRAGGRSKEEIRAAIAERAAQARDGARAEPPPAPELETVTITHLGAERSYRVEPSTLGEGRPAILIFHGARGDGARAAAAARITGLAAEAGFAVAYPEAAGARWSDGRAETAPAEGPGEGSGVDDVDFVRAVAEDLADRHGIDASRLFAAGISNGGMFVQRLACEDPGLFDGFAVVSANMPADLAETCAPQLARPMVFLHGTEDPLMPFEGGDLPFADRGGAGGRVLSQEETVAFWLGTRAGCGAPAEDAFDRVTDGTKVRTVRYDCAEGADLSAFVISGGGHAWPGSGAPETRLTGTVTEEVDATEAMVAFFQEHGL